jgi:hypothetical protein
MTDRLTDAELSELERLDREATPGPWEVCLGSGTLRCTAVKSAVTDQLVADVQPDYFLEHGTQSLPIERRADHQPDMDFIAASRSAIPRLLAEVRELRAALREGEHRCRLPDSIDEALNSGDGSYKP